MRYLSLRYRDLTESGGGSCIEKVSTYFSMENEEKYPHEILNPNMLIYWDI